MNRARHPLFVCLVLIGLSVSPAAQDKPSFAGTWKLSDPTTPEPFTPTVMTVVQDATTLTVTTTSQMGEYKTSYRLDGSEAPSPLNFNGVTIERMTKLAWQGTTLMLITHDPALAGRCRRLIRLLDGRVVAS